MEKEEDIDYEVATDEESLKIRRLEHDLKSVSSSEDKKLFIWLGMGLASILLYAIKPGFLSQILVLTVVPVSVLGGIGSAIYQNIRKKKKILIKHGLQCKNCGFIPSTFNASGVLGSAKCPKCHAKLEI